MYKYKKFLAIIPARGGSKGVPRKNIKNLAGKPLIAWTIAEANKSKYIDTCMVSTEDEEIKQVAESYGGYVPFMRPSEFARDDSPSIDAILHAVDNMPGYDYIVLLQPTSPLRIAEDIDGTIELCFKGKSLSAVSVTESEKSPYWMYTLNETGEMSPVLTIDKEKSYQRQKLPKVYRLNGAVYVTEKNFLKKTRGFIDAETLGYVMPTARSLDIDSILDFKLAEFIIRSVE